MNRKISNSTLKVTTLALVSLVLSSCVPNVGTKLRLRDSSSITSVANVGVTQGLILADNPIILSNNAGLSDSYDLNKLLSVAFINDSNNTFLDHCYGNGSDYCFKVLDVKESTSPLQTSNGKWAYKATSPEFLQVNTFYHLNRISQTFYSNFVTSYSRAYDTFGTQIYNTALPAPSTHLLKGTIAAIADCDVDNNAFFAKADGTLCFGYVTTPSNSVKWAQDSSVVYHETGHFLQDLQLNLRNVNAGPVSANMGSGLNEEAGAIGEGLSDFYSYFITGRPHFAEWAAGRFLGASRPMTESDPLHAPGISTDPDQRLSYPQYINYDANNPTTPTEDIHQTGMMISHYLVALNQDLQTQCAMTKQDASNLIIHLLSETLAELGDLQSNGTQAVNTHNKVNLSPAYAYDWVSKVNPITYRKFSQTFAKNLLVNLGKPIGSPALNRCNGGIYAKDQIESLLDQYGLLLFRTYNENRNLSNPPILSNTAVTATNRKKSVLISKNLLIFDPTTNASTAFVIDDAAKILSGVTSLQKAGIIGSLSAQTPSDLGFNNNNSRISPGEVVAIGLNLYNNSNSTMGGIQILANDWNQADASGNPYQFPASFSNDQWPLTSEGGVVFNPATTSISAGAATNFAPACFMQSTGNSSTKWISQNAFKTKMALDSSLCLDPNNTKDCFIRFIKGADQAHYSKLNPKSTWSQTMLDTKTGKSLVPDWNNVMLMEVSKHIPPGTVVDCRLRLRFTNCDDCYHKQSSDSTKTNYYADPNVDGYDFTDTDYNGPRPFKIIHLQIPITD